MGRVITDDGFRKRAQQALEATCFREGVVVSPEELALLARLDLAILVPIAESLDGSLRRK